MTKSINPINVLRDNFFSTTKKTIIRELEVVIKSYMPKDRNGYIPDIEISDFKPHSKKENVLVLQIQIDMSSFCEEQ